MRPLFKIQFTLVPNDGRSPKQISDEVMTTVTDWIKDHYQKKGLEPVEPNYVAEITRHRDDPYQIKNASLLSGEFHRAVFWSHFGGADANFSWNSLCDVVYAGNRLDFQFVLGVEAEDYSQIPSDLTPARPRLIPNILANPHWTCVSGGTGMPLVTKTLTVHDVERFCEADLFSDDRTHPIVVMAPRPDGKRYYAIKPGLLADRIAGVGQVVTLRDDLALMVFNQYLGSNLWVEPDGIRVYAPGVEPGGDPSRHWHFLGETIRSRNIRQNDFANFLFAKLADRAVVSVSDSPALIAFRVKSREQQNARLEKIENELGVRAEEAEELFFEVGAHNEELKERIASLGEILEEREDQIRALKYQLELAHHNIAELSKAAGAGVVPHAQVAEEPKPPGTILDVVRISKKECKRLVILPSALDSAKEVPETYKFVDRVRAHLFELDTAAGARKPDGSLGTGWKQYFKGKGMDYRPKISDTTRNNWGDEYTFPYDGKTALFEEHFTIGVKSANTCLSIHFSTRLRTDKIVVAYVGRHLRNTQT